MLGYAEIWKISEISYDIYLYLKLKRKGMQFNVLSNDKTELSRPK